MKNLLIACCVLLLWGCTSNPEEIARLDLKQISTRDQAYSQEVVLDLKRGEELSFWTEMDMDFDDELSLLYTVEYWQDTTRIGGFKLNAFQLNPRVLFDSTGTEGSHRKWRLGGRMNFLKVDADGQYTFKAVLNSSDNPALVVRQADLIFKK